MRKKTAVLVGSSVLTMAALSTMAHAQARAPSNGLSYYAYDQPAPVRPEADRKAEHHVARPARVPEILYFNVEGGFETLSINTLVAAGSITTGNIHPVSASTSGSGPLYGVGGGIRLGFFTLGGRVRGAHLGVGDLSTIDGELGARITLNRVEPYFTFAGGYAKLMATGSEVAGISDLNIHGWNARAGLGVDYYAHKNFTVGVNFTGDLLAMARPGIDLSTSPEAQARERVKVCEALTDPSQQQQCATNIVHDTEGSSAGFAGTMSIVMGVHF
jgi:hypothetical protein